MLQPILGKLIDPNRQREYVDSINKMYDLVFPPGTGTRARADAIIDPRDSSQKETLLLDKLIDTANKAKSSAPRDRKNEAGYNAVVTSYSGIALELEKVWKKYRNTNFGKRLYENSALLVRPKYLGNYTEDDIRSLYRAYQEGVPGGREPTSEEKRYISTQEDPGIARSNLQHWKTKWLSTKDQNYKNFDGTLMGFDFIEVEYEAPDPTDHTGRRTIKVKEALPALFDNEGRVRTEILFPASSNRYIQKRAEAYRDGFKRAFEQTLIFGDTMGLSKRLNAWLEIEALKPGKYRQLISEDKRKNIAYEDLFRTTEGRDRLNLFSSELMKDFAAKYNKRINDYFKKYPDKPRNGQNILLAINSSANISKCYVNEFNPVTGRTERKFDGLRAILLAEGIDPDSPRDKVRRDQYIKRVTDNFYIQFLFKEISVPRKDDARAKQLGYQNRGWVQYRDRGVRPDQEAAEALMKDLLSQSAGKFLFDGDSYTTNVGTVAKIVPGPDGTRIKIVFADGREIYLDPDNYTQVQARTMMMGEAYTMHQQIQALTRDPLNFPVVWAYQGIGNALINTIPGARPTYNTIFKILKQRNSLMPKKDQLSLKGVQNWATLLMKRSILWPMYVYDPETGFTAPRYAYIARKAINTGLDWLSGDEFQPGALDKALQKLKIKEFYYDPETKTIKKRDWDPRVFNRIFATRRQKERQSIFDLAIKMTVGIVVDGVISYIAAQIPRLPVIGRAVGQGIHLIKQVPKIPLRLTNALFRQLPVEGLMKSSNLNVDALLGRRFLGGRIYNEIIVPEGRFAVLGGGIRSRLAYNLSNFFTQNGLRNGWQWTKTIWGGTGKFIKSFGQAIPAAIIAGVAFNSPAALLVTFAAAGAPRIMMNFAELAREQAIFADRFSSWDRLGQILYDKHSLAAQVFSESTHTLPKKFFGMDLYEAVAYDPLTKTPNLWRLKDTYLSRFLSNHANVRGLLKGMGRAALSFNVAYILTGNLFAAAAIGAATIGGSILVENIAKVVSAKWSSVAGKLSVLRAPSTMLGSMAMGGVNMAIGLNFLREGVRAWLEMARTGDSSKWDEWLQVNFGGVLPTVFSISAVAGFASGVAGFVNLAVKLGTLIVDTYNSLQFTAAAGGPIGRLLSAVGLSRYASIGALIGGTIGGVLGAIFGAQIGAAVFGTLGGAIGGVLGGIWGGAVIGGTIGTAVVPIIGTALGGLIGAIAGAITGGTIGSFIGIGIERFIGPKFAGLGAGFRTLFGLLGKIFNIIGVLRLLASLNIGDVGQGALILATMGILTFATVEDTLINSSSYMVSAPELYEELVVIPPSIKDFEKTIETPGFIDNGRTVVFRINVTNTDEQNRNISVKYQDVLTFASEEVQRSMSYFPIYVDPEVGLIEDRNDKQLTLTENKEVVLPKGESHMLLIRYTSEGKSFPELIREMPNEKLCNRAILTGQIEGGEALNAETVICLDPEGNITGPGGKCPVDSGRISQGCFMGGKRSHTALDIATPKGQKNNVYAPTSGIVYDIWSPEYTSSLKNKDGTYKYHSVTGCYDGGWAIFILGDDGYLYSYWHVMFDTSSMDNFYINSREIRAKPKEIATRVNEGDIIAKVWDGGAVDGDLAQCYLNPGDRGQAYIDTFWTGDHIHFSIKKGNTFNCAVVENFIKDNCGNIPVP